MDFGGAEAYLLNYWANYEVDGDREEGHGTGHKWGSPTIIIGILHNDQRWYRQKKKMWALLIPL